MVIRPIAPSRRIRLLAVGPRATPSVYLAVVNTLTGASSINRVNNDPFNDSKDHFFAWATAKPSGAVYVGWYDNRNDPFNAKVEYFVGKSTDGGKTFPRQMAISDTAFNPCVGFPGLRFLWRLYSASYWTRWCGPCRLERYPRWSEHANLHPTYNLVVAASEGRRLEVGDQRSEVIRLREGSGATTRSGTYQAKIGVPPNS